MHDCTTTIQHDFSLSPLNPSLSGSVSVSPNQLSHSESVCDTSEESSDSESLEEVDVLAPLFCAVYGLRALWLGLRVVLQSFHHSSTACFGENVSTEGPLNLQ